MTDEDKKESLKRGVAGVEGLDPAGKSLAEALRVSFVILKVIMAVLAVLFLLSGFKVVESDEKAIVLRFGKVRGAGESAILGPGWHWIFPYPIDEMVRIPVENMVNLPINSFWYYEDPADLLPDGSVRRPRIDETLKPTRDGYCIVRGEQTEGRIAAGAGSDYNIVHSKWVLTYQITDPIRFFQNVYVDMDNIEPGQNYADVIGRNVEPMLKSMFEDAVVRSMVNYTIDEAIASKETIPGNVGELLQERLDEIDSGVRVASVQMSNSIWPRQVEEAFIQSTKAAQQKETAIREAQTYRDKALNEAAGAVSEELLATVLGEKKVSKEQEDFLWSQLAGKSQGKIAQARAYRREVVESAKANAAYLQAILPEYRERPELVLHNLYAEAIERIFGSVDEKVVIDNPTSKELRIQLNRNPAIAPASEGKKEESSSKK